MNAETAYLFRHALLRDAAYQLQLPVDRARLHAMAFEILEQSCSVRPVLPEDAWNTAQLPHDSDPVCFDLAAHAKLASEDIFQRADARPDIVYAFRAGHIARKSHQHEQARATMESVADNPSAPATLRLAARYFAANAALQDGKPALAEALLADTMTQLEPHCREMAMCLGLKATLDLRLGRSELARESSERALAIARKHGMNARELQEIGFLAILHQRKGENARAESRYREAIAASQLKGESSQLPSLYANLAGLLCNTGRMKEAEEMFALSLEWCRKRKDVSGEGHCLGNLAVLHAKKGNSETARKLLNEALEIARKTHDRRDEARWLGMLAVECQNSGNLDQSAELFESALAITRETEDLEQMGYLLGNLAIVRQNQKRFDVALRDYDEAIRAFRNSHAHGNLAFWLVALASLKLEMACYDETVQLLEEALPLTRHTENRTAEGACLALQSIVAVRRSQPSAVEWWSRAMELLRPVSNELQRRSMLDEMNRTLAELGLGGLTHSGDLPAGLAGILLSRGKAADAAMKTGRPESRPADS